MGRNRRKTVFPAPLLWKIGDLISGLIHQDPFGCKCQKPSPKWLTQKRRNRLAHLTKKSKEKLQEWLDPDTHPVLLETHLFLCLSSSVWLALHAGLERPGSPVSLFSPWAISSPIWFWLAFHGSHVHSKTNQHLPRIWRSSWSNDLVTRRWPLHPLLSVGPFLKGKWVDNCLLHGSLFLGYCDICKKRSGIMFKHIWFQMPFWIANPGHLQNHLCPGACPPSTPVS